MNDKKMLITGPQMICFKGRLHSISIIDDYETVFELTCIKNDIGCALNNETIEVHFDSKKLDIPSKEFELDERLVVYGFLFTTSTKQKKVNVVAPISLARDKKEMSLEDFKRIVRFEHGVWTCDPKEYFFDE